MAEFNPYKLEEEKWTPKNVYEILPPNAVSWSDYEFGQGTDNVDTEAANKSLIDGFVDFFAELLGTAGKILGGAVELGGAVLGGFVDGVVSLIGGIANAIGSIFGGGSSESPNLPLFNPIKTNLEAAIQPHRDKINESWQKTEEILAEQEVLRGQMADSLDEMRDASARAQEASERAGVAIGEAEAAVAAAKDARETLESYNTELNKRITSEFNAAVGRADTAVEKADTLAQQLADFQAQHQREINDAISKAEKANADLALLSPKVADAVNKASKATSDVSALTPKVTDAVNKADSAYSEVGKFTTKIEEAQSKGETALAVADKAVGWLKNPVEIGTSIIAVNPETKRPYYADKLELVDDNPPSTAGPTYMRPEAMAGVSTYGPQVAVDPKIKYTVSFWAKASKPGSILYGQFRNNTGTMVAPDGSPMSSGAVDKPTPPQPSNKDEDGKYVHGNIKNSYFISRLELQTEWTYYETEIQFAEGITSVGIGVMYWNHTYGERADQYISGLDIRPQIPTQASVDQAQNDAIRANSDILRQQGEINEAQRVANLAQKSFNDNQTKWNQAVDVALATQKKVNDNFKKWTDGATEAIEANKNAIKALNAPQVSSSALPLIPGTSTPTWTAGLTESTRAPDSTADAALPSNITKLYSSGWVDAKKEKSFTNPHRNLVTVDSRIEYEASWWMRATRGGRFAFVTLCDENGDGHIIEKLPATELDSNPSQYTWGYPIRAIITSPDGTGWTKFTTRFKFKEGVTKVRVYNLIFSNTDNDSGTTYYIADLQINPAIPSQADVDKAQNDAISANTEALKALGKKVLGASLVPYKTPSTKEVEDYAAGKLNYDPWADPEYLNAGHSITSPARGRVARANSNQGTKNFTGSYVTVDSNIEYKVKFHTYASLSGSNLYIYMHDQNDNLALAETPFTNISKTAGGLVHNLTLPAGIKEWSGVIKFKPGTTQVRLGTFYWNHPNGSTTGTQEFGGLEIVPNIPDANVVNELQDNAIRKNTEVGTENKNAIEALRDGLNAAVELGEVNGMLEDLRGELEAEAKKREALQEKIDALQTEMIPRTIVSDDRVTYDDYVKLSRREVTAKGSWAGQLAITYTIDSGKKTLVTRKNVPDGTTRSWTFSDGVERVDYWVYQGRPRTILLMNAGPYITGSSFSSGTWGVLATHKVGKTYGTGKIEWRGNLRHADRGVTYRFKIEVNGVEVKNVSWTNQGPLTPLGDGKRTLKFEHEFNLPDDATVRLLGYATKASPFNAEVSLLQGTLVYVQDTAREAQ